jgi:hypothetical protein
VEEAVFLASLRATLDRVQPAQVDPAETTLTAEGPFSLIAILPHRALGGVSIVAWRYAVSLRVLWAAIDTLGYHDDLDLGLEVATFSEDTHGEPWQAAALECVERELHRPLQLQVVRSGARGHERARVTVQLEGGKLEVWKVGRWSPLDWFRRWEPASQLHQVPVRRSLPTADPRAVWGGAMVRVVAFMT